MDFTSWWEVHPLQFFIIWRFFFVGVVGNRIVHAKLSIFCSSNCTFEIKNIIYCMLLWSIPSHWFEIQVTSSLEDARSKDHNNECQRIMPIYSPFADFEENCRECIKWQQVTLLAKTGIMYCFLNGWENVNQYDSAVLHRICINSKTRWNYYPQMAPMVTCCHFTLSLLFCLQTALNANFCMFEKVGHLKNVS